MPFISVIMACHNAGIYVSEAIRSVLDQTFSDLELIIVDDASVDDSLEVARAFAQLDRRVQVYSTDGNIGAGAARNLAIDKSTGEWIAVLDADDVFIKEKLEKQVALIKSSGEELVLVGTGCFQISADGRRFAVYQYPATSLELINRLISHKAFPPHSSLMYRASTVRSIGGFNSLFLRAEDFELWLRMRKSGTFACVAEPLVEYRLHDANISNSSANTGYSQINYAIAASVCDLLQQRGLIVPSSVGDKILWDRFMLHVAAEVKACGELEYQEWKRTWRKTMHLKKGYIAKLTSVIHQLVVDPDSMLRLVKEHTVGSQLPQKCLLSWQRKSPCVVS